MQAVKAVADTVQKHQVPHLVVDPVLVATSGDSLAGSEVAQALKQHLFPIATVITPNLPEASALLDGRTVDDLTSMKQVRIGCYVHMESSSSKNCAILDLPLLELSALRHQKPCCCRWQACS